MPKTPLLIVVAVLSMTSRGASAETPASIKVGSLTLNHCVGVLAYCGDLPRALDPALPAGKRISIHFKYYPHTTPRAAVDTIVATEGGPGFPATLSRDEYLVLFKPLLGSRDFLLMNNRGTGKSGAVNCPELEAAPKMTAAVIGACGRSLGSAAPLPVKHRSDERAL